MSITIEALKSLFQKPFTEEYPKRKKRFFPRYRGRVEWSKDRCIRCLKCVKACPNNALSFKDDRIVVDHTKCINCGVCEEVCPVKEKAIYLTRKLPKIEKD